jgi:hypothetical protein
MRVVTRLPITGLTLIILIIANCLTETLGVNPGCSRYALRIARKATIQTAMIIS